MNLRIIISTFVALIWMPLSAIANQDGGGHAAILYGISVPDAPNTVMHQLHGVTGGASVTEKVSIGGYHFLSSREDGPNSTQLKYTLTGLAFRVKLKSGDKNIFVGLRAGISKVNSTDSSGLVVYSPYHYGIVSGYYIKLFSKVSIGFEGSYLAVNKSTTFNGTSDVTFNAFHNINFLVSIGVFL